MKIAYVTTEFTSEAPCGGQARYLENVAILFANHGHDVYVIVKSNQDQIFLWKDKITVVRVRCSFEISIGNRIFKRYRPSFFLNKCVNKLHRRLRFDIIQYSSLQGIPLLMSRFTPSIVRISSFEPICRRALVEDFDVTALCLNFSEKRELDALKKAKIIIGPSRVCAELITQYIHKEIKIIESPVCVHAIMKKPAFFDSLLQNKKYFLFFGTLNFLKGLHMVCNIADVFLENHPDTYIVFLGSNVDLTSKNGAFDSYSYIQRTIKNRNRVFVLGSIYEKEYSNYIISHAEACLMPSRMDNLPNTCIEAMALGKVVIGTRGASFEQLIEDNYSGFLVDRDNEKQLLAAMDKVYKLSKEEKNTLGNNAKMVVKRMEPELIYNQLLALYKVVCEPTYNK